MDIGEEGSRRVERADILRDFLAEYGGCLTIGGEDYIAPRLLNRKSADFSAFLLRKLFSNAGEFQKKRSGLLSFNHVCLLPRRSEVEGCNCSTCQSCRVASQYLRSLEIQI